MHVMVDIEALGFGEKGQLLQLAAVAFELNGSVLDPHELLQYEDRWFNARVLPHEACVQTPSAVEFWSSDKSKAAADLIEAMPGQDLCDVLMQFNTFLRQWLGKRGSLWAKPIGFDLHILRGNYAVMGIAPAWHPRDELDLRTLLHVARRMPKQNFRVPDVEGQGFTKHFALHDAAIQAIAAQAAMWALTISAGQRIKGFVGKMPIFVGTDDGDASTQKQVSGGNRAEH